MKNVFSEKLSLIVGISRSNSKFPVQGIEGKNPIGIFTLKLKVSSTGGKFEKT